MRSDAEERLLCEWSPANLEAFGAELRAAGSPRGELIALDFVLERERGALTREALNEEKKALQIAWLGGHGETLVTRFGFIEDIKEEPEALAAMIDTIAPYARTFYLWGDPPQVHPLLERLVATPRPWLRSLRVRTFGEQSEVLVDNALAQRLVEATPHLKTLHACGHLVFADVPHPSVEVLLADGHDALGALSGRGVMPNVRTLDFALHPDFTIRREPPPDVLRDGLLPRSGFPRLVRLELARNEPCPNTLAPNCFGGATPLFEVLPRFRILPHVAELRVPSLRSAAQVKQLEAAVAELPQLRVEVARTYGVQHSSTRFAIQPPVSWPAGNELRDYDALVFQDGAEWVRLDLRDAYELCEQHHDPLPANERAAWAAVWQLVRSLGTDDAQRVATLAKADLDAFCNSLAIADPDLWSSFGKRWGESAAPSVAVRRIDGFESPDEQAPVGPRVVASSESILEHEHALQQHWDLDRLAVYADELQQHGDLRGDLIALDLRMEREGKADLSYEHDQLHDQIFPAPRYTVSSKLGLSIVDMTSYSKDDDGPFEDAFRGDVARYLGELELRGEADWVEAALRVVIAEPRPWLRTVRVFASRATTPALSLAEAQPAWPHLEMLELGIDDALTRPLVQDYTHPNVRRMRITGVHGFEPLGTPWPALTELDFAFGVDVTDVPQEPAQLFTHAKLPALRTLDLSRNEPAATAIFTRHERHQCALDVFAQLADIDSALLAELTHLALPSPRTTAHVADIQATLDRAPNLTSLVIARRYPQGPEVVLAHSRATLTVPAPSPWVPFDDVDDGAFVIESVTVPLAAVVTALEKFYDRLSEAGRRAWDELWARAGAPLVAQFEIPAQTFYTAVDALQALRLYMPAWVQELATHLHPLALAEKTIRVTLGTAR